MLRASVVEELIKDHIRKTVFELDEWKGKNQRFTIAVVAGRPMTGEIDGLITDPLGVKRVLEIKSINHFGFERLDKEPLPEHRRQVILYKNKNTAAMKEFIIVYDEAQALADIEMFDRAVKAGVRRRLKELRGKEAKSA